MNYSMHPKLNSTTRGMLYKQNLELYVQQQGMVLMNFNKIVNPNCIENYQTIIN